MKKREGQGRLIEWMVLVFLLVPSTLWGLEAGYSKGFYLRSDDGKYSVTIRIRGQIQGFIDSKEKDSEREETGGFIIRRARLYFSGNAFLKELKYNIQLTLEDKVGVRDLYVEYPVLGKHASIKAGQFKVPFNREELTSSANLELVDRSITTKYFYIGRDIGVSLTGALFEKSFNYAIGIFSGEGKNSKPQDINPLLAARLVFSSKENIEEIWKTSQGAFEKSLFWSIGIAGIYGDSIRVGKDEWRRDDLSEFLKPATGVVRFSFFELSGDAVLKYYPFSFESEVNYGKMSYMDKNGLGIRAQAGLFLTKEWEVVGRYGMVKVEGKDVINEFTGGLSWFISDNHHLKLQSDFSFITQNRELLGRLQLQLYL